MQPDTTAALGSYLPIATPPAPVRALRVLLYLTAVLSVVIMIAYLASGPVMGETVGRAVWGVWPGLVAFVLADRLFKPSRRVYWFVVALGVVYALRALSTIGQGDPRGVTNLALPALILILVLRGSSRAYLRQNR